MSPRFTDSIIGWGLGLGFVVTLLLIGMFWELFYDQKIKTPFAWIGRQIENWLAHRREMSRIRMRVKSARSGVDPDYVAFLESREK